MTLTNPPVAVSSFDSGRLAAGISAAATTITISPIYKTVNGVRTKQGLDTTSGIALITQGDFTERVSFEGASVNATTKVTTLTTCTRGLSATSTSASFTGGTGRAWPKGAKFTVVADVSYFQSSVYTTVPNSFSAKQTFAAGADFTSVTRPPKLPTLSQAQENALTPEEGMMWKNSDTGTNRQYVGGSIVDIGDAGTPNGSTTVAGKFEAATAAQRATGTGTGETGALLIPTNDALVKTSSGAGDENKIPVLDATGKLASGFLPTATSATFTNFFGDGSDGDVTLGSNTTLTRDMFYNNLDLSTFTLSTAGFRVFVADTLSGSGKIERNGNAGTAGGSAANTQGSAGGSAGSGGAPLSGGYLPGSVAGVNGRAGQTTVSNNGVNGTAGLAGTADTNTIGGNGAAGGAGGAGGNGGGFNGGTAGAAGAAGAATGLAVNSGGARNLSNIIPWRAFPDGASPVGFKGNAGGGGGGGSGSGTNDGTVAAPPGSGGSGGSGSNGGTILVCAKTMTGTFTIEAKGGAGGNGGNAGTLAQPPSNNGGSGGGGGGAGGSGGVVGLVYHEATGWSGSVVVTGGAGGTGGTGGQANGTGQAGSNGSSGSTGTSGISLIFTV